MASVVDTSLKTKKIAIVGLANAGKTTLIRTLQHRYHIGESFPPTKNVERSQISLFGQLASVWDYGGQEKYREIYLTKPDRYFSELGYLFYIVDIQDATHFPDSIDYFNKIYQNALSLNNDIISIIIFNKVDPQIAQDTTVMQRIESLKKEFSKIVEAGDISFFVTSAYDPLTILNAFSNPIIGNKPIYNAISTLFANFGITHNIEYMVLLIDDLLEIGSFRIRTTNEQFVEATLKFYQQFANLEIDQKLRNYEFEGYNFMIIRGHVLKFNYTLSIAHKNSSADDVPKESELAELLTAIEDNFRKYPPNFD